MKTTIAAMAAACLLGPAAAHATVYKLTFSATGLASTDGSTPLQETVAGSILFTKPVSDYDLPVVRGIDLTIGGHTYRTSDIVAEPRAGGYGFGAKAAGVEGLAPGTDDFYLFVLGRYEGFGYTVAGLDGAWTTRHVSATDDAVAEVPEPGGVALLLAGAGALAALRRRTPGASHRSAARQR